MSFDLNDVQNWKKDTVSEEKEKATAVFVIKDIVTSDGHTRKVPMIEFKSEYNKFRLRSLMLDYVTFNNFPKLQPEFAKYYMDCYKVNLEKNPEDCLEDCDSNIKSILIYYGYYSLKYLKSITRNMLMTSMRDVKEDFLIKIISYLESKGCFISKKTPKKEVIIDNSKNEGLEAKINQLFAENEKKDKQIEELITLLKTKKTPKKEVGIEGVLETTFANEDKAKGEKNGVV